LLTDWGKNEYDRDFGNGSKPPGHGWPFVGRSVEKLDKRLSKPAISKYYNGS
jgi:hypothetical protein